MPPPLRPQKLRLPLYLHPLPVKLHPPQKKLRNPNGAEPPEAKKTVPKMRKKTPLKPPLKTPLRKQLLKKKLLKPGTLKRLLPKKKLLKKVKLLLFPQKRFSLFPLCLRRLPMRR